MITNAWIILLVTSTHTV